MADLIKNTLWAVVLVLVLSLAMDVAGITLHDDYDGKQIIDQIVSTRAPVKGATLPRLA